MAQLVRLSKGVAGEHVRSVLSSQTEAVEDYYTYGEKLGEGHFGVTYEVIEKETGKRYALKRLAKARLAMLGTPLEELQREIGILYHLEGHANVVQVREAFEDGRCVYIVMELCEGGELYDRIVNQGYSEKDGAEVMRAILSVVAHCHSLGVVHRDLKPENFLFVDGAEDSPLKAIDFGLSIFFKKGESVGQGLAGSPMYVAPEMIESHGERYTEAVDVWSAGVIMYMLLSGYFPFRSDLPSMGDLFSAILEDEISYDEDPWPSISQEAKALLQGLLNRDPKKRLTAVQALAHPWIAQAGVAPDEPIDPAVARRLRSYAKLNRFRKLASRIIAQHLSEEQILGMKEIFRQMDVDKSGTITLDELRQGLQQMGANVCEAEMQKLFAAADTDDSNTVDVDEFIAASLGCHRLIKEENLHLAFEQLDKDGSGNITIDELRQVSEDFGFSTDNLVEMFAEADVNKDKKIDYKEFVALVHQKQASDAAVSKSHSLGKDKSVLPTLRGWRQP